MDLSTRETAILVWLLVGVAFCLAHPGIRPAFWHVVRAATQWRLLVLFGALYAYLGLVIWGLSALSLWDLGQTKNTMAWSVAVGIVTMFRLPNLAEDVPFFRDWLLDNLKLIALVEFIVAFYTFPLPVELMLQPVLFFVFGMLAVAGSDERYKSAKAFLDGLVTALGLGVILYTVYMLFSDFEGFFTARTLRDFYTPIALSLTLLPFMFGVRVFMTYERVFKALPFVIRDDDVRRYARLRALLAFGGSPTLLSRWHRYVSAHSPGSRDDVLRAIRDVQGARRRENMPVSVPAANGWSPDLARHFLTPSGIVTRDYHRFHDEWYASSDLVELSSDAMPDNVGYYIEGDDLVATRLRLVLNVNNPAEPAASEARFAELCVALARASLGQVSLPATTADFEANVDGKVASLRTEHWAGGIPGGYKRVFEIAIGDSNRCAPTE
jgi:hypothetical protein